MDGFRITCDLSAFLDGIRKRSFLYVDVTKLYTISDLCMQIRTSFNIKKSVALMIDDIFLPFEESIKILRANEVVKVVLVDTGSSYSCRNGNDIPQVTEEIIKDYSASTENISVQVLPSPHQRKRRRRNRNDCEIPSENDTQVLLETTTDSAQAAGTESPKLKKNRKERKPCKKPDEEIIDQKPTDLIPEANSCKTEQSSTELVTDQPVPDIPLGKTEESLPSRKRKRIRTRKKKSVAPEMNTQQNSNDKPALNPYAINFNSHVDPSVSHIRFSTKMADGDKNESLGYNPLEDDLLMRHDEPVKTESTTGNAGSEMNGINRIISESTAPLVVRRVKVEPSRPVQAARKFLQHPPGINDIVTFKIWKMDENYCPQISGLIKAKILNFCNDTKQVKFFILDGKHHCEQPNGKFSLDEDFAEDGPSEPPFIPDIMELNWQEMLEVEIFL